MVGVEFAVLVGDSGAGDLGERGFQCAAVGDGVLGERPQGADERPPVGLDREQEFAERGRVRVTSNPLELGCDCLGDIHCFDATIADDRATQHDPGGP